MGQCNAPRCEPWPSPSSACAPMGWMCTCSRRSGSGQCPVPRIRKSGSRCSPALRSPADSSNSRRTASPTSRGGERRRGLSQARLARHETRRWRRARAPVAGSNVFVFSSHTDTFGLVVLEAMACGLPVAADPVARPGRRGRERRDGVLDEDLRAAAVAELELNPAPLVRRQCRHSGRQAGQSTSVPRASAVPMAAPANTSVG